jgi:geranylgeranyl pyrophosphate synthase
LLGNKKLNQTAANKLIIKLDGINKTNKLAKKYFDETIEYANKIKKLSIKQEMIELANIAINRDK